MRTRSALGPLPAASISQGTPGGQNPPRRSFVERAAPAMGWRGAHRSLWCQVGPKLLPGGAAGWAALVEVLEITWRTAAVCWWSLQSGGREAVALKSLSKSGVGPACCGGKSILGTFGCC